MNQDEIERFALLHQRVAKGETLAESDRSFYESLRSVLDTEETLQVTQQKDDRARRIEALEAELSFLQEARLLMKARLESSAPARAA